MKIAYFFYFLTVVGSILIAEDVWLAWIMWIASNTYFLVNAVKAGDKLHARYFAILLVLAVYGIYKWI